MPLIKKLSVIEDSYAYTSFTSDYIFLGDVSSLTLSFLCSNNCDLAFEYSIDEKHEVIYTETFSIISNTPLSFLNKLVRTRYIRVLITNIPLFSKLLVQGFYHVY